MNQYSRGRTKHPQRRYHFPDYPINFYPLHHSWISPLTLFSDNSDDAPPSGFPAPLEGAKIRYLQTLLNEVQNVRLDLAL